MPFKIFCVGFDFPGGECEYLSHRSERSLLDADIIIFRPGLGAEYGYGEFYKGLPRLYDNSSFDFKRDLNHWCSELAHAFKAGKTIIVYLSKPETVYVATGETQWSGTGRNARPTHYVAEVNSYSAIPLDLTGILPATGEVIRPAKDLGLLSEYWSLCSQYTRYEVYLGDETKKPLFFTKTGDKILGASVSGEKGTMLLLPNLDSQSWGFIHREEEEEDESEEEEGSASGEWTLEAIKFGKRLSACLAELHKSLITRHGANPAPSWTMESCYRLAEETALELEIEKIDHSIKELRKRRDKFTTEREKSGGLRRLLFEKGKQLEISLLDALRLMGFQAESFQDAESEFDQVFVSAEGRFLGETEGKDNGPINIDKLSQLERNIQEDFAKEGVAEHANGVLFGNAFRLFPVKERKDFFTPKCLTGAKRSGIALVRTPDLFEVARYLSTTRDDDFSAQCRRAIVSGKGQIVKFPEIPHENTAAAQVGEVS